MSFWASTLRMTLGQVANSHDNLSALCLRSSSRAACTATRPGSASSWNHAIAWNELAKRVVVI